MGRVILCLGTGPIASEFSDGRSCQHALRPPMLRIRLYCTGERFKFQISLAYSLMVRSLENFPEQATLTIAVRAQASGSAYSAAKARWARA